ncbi:MAG: putative molybdenum carrier protein, partial [Chloroflexota bacterium]
DRGALDAALASDFPCGGWSPEGRQAEDHPIPDRYPVSELPGANYLRRTRQNVIDSDGTLVIYFTELTGGTLKTVQFCECFRKPALVLDGSELDPDTAASRAADFVRSLAIRTLNVAGPRESGHPGARAYAEQAVRCLLQNIR